jgi:AraC-like DNA-binding protein
VTTTILGTEGLEPADREAFWRHLMADTFVPVSIRDAARDEVRGFVKSNWIGRLMVANVQSTGQRHQRSERHIGQSDNQFFQVAIVANGVGRLSQDGRQAELHSGDCAVYETTRPFEWYFESDWSVWVFSMPSTSVLLTEDERRDLTARSLDGKAGLTGVMCRFLLDLARNSDQLSAGQSEHVLTHASDLVLTLLSSRVDRDDVRRANHRSLLLRIKDYINRRLSDPALTPAEIACAVNISTRYLYKVFEAENRSLSQYIRGLRLERSRRDLLDPRLAHRPVSAIAFSCGFGDVSGFNRAFKGAYGINPSELRRAGAEDARRRP